MRFLIALCLSFVFSAPSTSVWAQTADEKEAQKIQDQKKLLEGLMKSLSEKEKAKEEEDQQASEDSQIKSKIEMVPSGGTPRAIRDMSGYYEVFFIELKDSYVMAPGDKLSKNLKILYEAQSKKQKVSFTAGKINRNIYEVFPLTSSK